MINDMTKHSLSAFVFVKLYISRPWGREAIRPSHDHLMGTSVPTEGALLLLRDNDDEMYQWLCCIINLETMVILIFPNISTKIIMVVTMLIECVIQAQQLIWCPNGTITQGHHEPWLIKIITPRICLMQIIGHYIRATGWTQWVGHLGGNVVGENSIGDG